MSIERLPYSGESSHSSLAYSRYKEDLKRGKGLLQIKSVAAEITPFIMRSWAPRTFTDIETADGEFVDKVVCNISYHFSEHGSKYGTVLKFTLAAQEYFRTNRQVAVTTTGGLLKFPDGSLFEPSGRIVTFIG